MRRHRNRILYSAAAASLAVITASVFALATRASASPDPFQGVSAAENAPIVTPAPAVMAQIQQGPSSSMLSAVRLLPSTIAGNTAYAVPTTDDNVCLFVTHVAEACAQPLTSAVPALVDVSDPGGASTVGPTVFGIAEDGVGSISFTLDGVAHTAPVENNTFAFTATAPVSSDELTAITANFADGHTVTIG